MRELQCQGGNLEGALLKPGGGLLFLSSFWLAKFEKPHLGCPGAPEPRSPGRALFGILSFPKMRGLSGWCEPRWRWLLTLADLFRAT